MLTPRLVKDAFLQKREFEFGDEQLPQAENWINPVLRSLRILNLVEYMFQAIECRQAEAPTEQQGKTGFIFPDYISPIASAR